MKLLKWFSAPSTETSSHIAKERLKVALTYDRAGLAQGTVEQLRDEIIQLIAKHLEIRAEDIRINVDRNPGQEVLVASIPLQLTQRPRTPALSQEPAKKTSGRRRRRSRSPH